MRNEPLAPPDVLLDYLLSRTNDESPGTPGAAAASLLRTFATFEESARGEKLITKPPHQRKHLKLRPFLSDKKLALNPCTTGDRSQVLKLASQRRQETHASCSAPPEPTEPVPGFFTERAQLGLEFTSGGEREEVVKLADLFSTGSISPYQR